MQNVWVFIDSFPECADGICRFVLCGQNSSETVISLSRFGIYFENLTESEYGLIHLAPFSKKSSQIVIGVSISWINGYGLAESRALVRDSRQEMI